MTDCDWGISTRKWLCMWADAVEKSTVRFDTGSTQPPSRKDRIAHKSGIFAELLYYYTSVSPVNGPEALFFLSFVRLCIHAYVPDFWNIRRTFCTQIHLSYMKIIVRKLLYCVSHDYLLLMAVFRLNWGYLLQPWFSLSTFQKWTCGNKMWCVGLCQWSWWVARLLSELRRCLSLDLVSRPRQNVHALAGSTPSTDASSWTSNVNRSRRTFASAIIDSEWPRTSR